jgi:signal transduction histidine kinase
VLRRLLSDSAYLLTGLPLALASFVVLTAGLSMSAGLLLVWVGVPLAVATVGAASTFAHLERARLAALGRPLAEPLRLTVRHGGWRRYLDLLRDPSRWAEVAHGLVHLPVSLVTWSVALVWWTGSLVGLTSWAWIRFLPPGSDVGFTGLPELAPWLSRGMVNLLLGLVLVGTIVPVLRGCTALHEAVGAALLGPSEAQLQRRVDELAHSRSQAADAEAQSLRRLERDLHDGPQQRLIRLGMDLSTAERRLAGAEVDEAREVIAAARRQAEDALAELRALSRGIAPPVLADRGLVAALVAAVATSPVPAGLRTDVPDGTHLPAAVENAAYFAVCEALANAAKHAGATRVDVHLALSAGELVVTVTDDGRGGAQVLPGHGLAGLRDRAAGVDGVVELAGAPGHGTIVRMRIPCA